MDQYASDVLCAYWGDGRCLHKFVRSTWNILIVGTPWGNFLETTFLSGMGVGYLGKTRKTNLNILGTCDNKSSLCDTESGGAAHSKVNETVEK